MSVPEQQERETQTVAGVVTGLVPKGEETWQVQVQPPDSQYTKNLWTKNGELVGQIPTMIGRPVTFFCNVSHWTRPNGEPVRSLWVDGWTTEAAVAAPDTGNGQMQTLADPVAQAEAALAQARAAQAAAQAAAAQPQPQAQPQPGAVTPQQAWVNAQDTKEIRIMREAADKCGTKILAAMLLSGHLPPEQYTPQKLHQFLDSFAQRRMLFYETGSSSYDNDIPF